MTLREKQSKFARMVAALLLYAYAKGYEVTFGEAFRPKVTAIAYARQGKGIRNSLHRLKLAVDLNLFKDGVYLTDFEGHRELGEYWELLGGTWGGRFKRRDANHYSLEHNGVK